jgi:PAS domain S-box-containing protein
MMTESETDILHRQVEGLKAEVARLQKVESEAHYQSLFKTNHAVMLLIDPESAVIEDANPAACAYYGWSLEQLKKLRISEINTLTASEIFAQMQAARLEERRNFFFKHRRADGSIRDVEVYSGPLTVKGKTLLFSIIHDITERRQAEEALRRSEQAAQQLAKEKAAIAEIGRVISSSLNIEDVYERFAAEVRKIISFDRIAINLVNFNTGTISTQYVLGHSVEGRTENSEYPLAGTATAKVVASGCGFVIPNLLDEEVARLLPGLDRLRAAGLKSSLLAPLTSKGQAFGALVMMSTEDHKYSDRDLAVAQNVAAQISGAIANAELLKERKRAEEALKEEEEKFRLAFQTSPDAINLNRLSDGMCLDINEGFTRLTGLTREEAIGKTSIELKLWEDPKDRERLVRLLMTDGVAENLEARFRRKDGRVGFGLMSARILEIHQEKLILSITRDITNRKLAEQQRGELEIRLRQAQKMEAIGGLAGGIAHDFNNILSAIIGYTELAMLNPDAQSCTRELKEVLRAATRAKDLVKQILSFSRQSEEERMPVRVSIVVMEALKFLRATIPTTVDIQSRIDEKSGAVLANPGELHQIIMNLCTNAVHAIGPNTGLLTVAVDGVAMDPGLKNDLIGLEIGPYVRISVGDTGHGMEPAVIKRIFEPYFTTKDKGVGTGLGLAVVHGIVKKYGGVIKVESDPGKGSTFHVYLPEVADATPAMAEQPALVVGGSERILFVDDEKMLADIGKQALERLGYDVVARTSPIEALELFRARPDSFDLVVTDQTMPNMAGDELAKELIRIRADIPVIICTGYSQTIDQRRAAARGIKGFVMKPMLINEIAVVIRKALNH